MKLKYCIFLSRLYGAQERHGWLSVAINNAIYIPYNKTGLKILYIGASWPTVIWLSTLTIISGYHLLSAIAAIKKKQTHSTLNSCLHFLIYDYHWLGLQSKSIKSQHGNEVVRFKATYHKLKLNRVAGDISKLTYKER